MFIEACLTFFSLLSLLLLLNLLCFLDEKKREMICYLMPLKSLELIDQKKIRFMSEDQKKKIMEKSFFHTGV